MKKKLLNYFKWGNIVYLFLVIANLLIELFQIYESSTIVTLFGIKIITKITPNELNTTFLLDNRLLLSYSVTILLFLLIGYLLNRGKMKETKK